MIEQITKNSNYAIFDDIEGQFEFFKGYKKFFGCQMEFVATDKYHKKKYIKWGKPSIWLSNQDPRETGQIDIDWWNGNVITCEITEPIAWVTQDSDQ